MRVKKTRFGSSRSTSKTEVSSGAPKVFKNKDIRERERDSYKEKKRKREGKKRDYVENEGNWKRQRRD